MTVRHRLFCGIVLQSLVLINTPTGATTRIVKPDGTGDVPTIQDGVNASLPGDSVVLAPGIFTGVGNRDVDYGGKAIVVTSQGGAAATIIDCEGLGRGFQFVNGEDSTSVLSNVTITNGHETSGGAIYAFGAAPTITDNIITGNTADEYGGGIYSLEATPGGGRIAHNTISDNDVDTGMSGLGRGGGILAETIQVIEDNTITRNSADNGGGVWFQGTSGPLTLGSLINNTITNNTAHFHGGGVYVNLGALSLAGNLIIGNYAATLGGGMYLLRVNDAIENCVVANDSCGVIGSGIYLFQSFPTLTNVTMAYNMGPDAIALDQSSVTIERSIIAFNSGYAIGCYSYLSQETCVDFYGNQSNGTCVSGSDVFYLDPLFCDATNGDYRLASGSPCLPANSPCGQLVGALPECVATGVGPTPRTDGAVLEIFPNPFNPSTTIRYGFARRNGPVTVVIYDVRGRRVRTLVNEQQAAAVRSVKWDGRDDNGVAAGSGVYFCQVKAPGVLAARRMVLLK